MCLAITLGHYGQVATVHPAHKMYKSPSPPYPTRFPTDSDIARAAQWANAEHLPGRATRCLAHWQSQKEPSVESRIESPATAFRRSASSGNGLEKCTEGFNRRDIVATIPSAEVVQVTSPSAAGAL
jgi:hypothetical protein